MTTYTERLRAIREERPARDWNVTRATIPTNAHVDDDEAARRRFIATEHRGPHSYRRQP